MGEARLCIRGEYQTEDNKCSVCQDRTFNFEENQRSCQICPENANCKEGDNITVIEGFWRINTSSAEVF